MRELIGNSGHLFVILSFVTSIISSIAYFKATQSKLEADISSWKVFARSIFGIHVFSVFGIVIALYIIISNHYYEYHYAWSHSSNFLPTHFMISCFWEGQEGSFLLWIFWHAILGVVLVFGSKKWEFPVMAVFMAVQAFLASMIIGIMFFNLKIGSSPFILMREVMYDAPIFQMNPNFIPEDGSGLNPLLQNYWMVIHPPTLFLGFALTLVPFAYCIAGLWKKDYTGWIKPVLPWMSFSVMILGTGILMGAYWAYETLNFGGYWNWDPVENAVYVPWLTMVAALHGLVLYQTKQKGYKLSLILVCVTFLLILYSTFLTRSGILGNASVHSFTDLGLSGQLLIYLFAFILLTFIITFLRWKELPDHGKESPVFSPDFWIFIGIAVLLVASFQVIMATSIPVFNAIKGLFAEKGRLAPPADQIAYYTKFQIWAGIFIALLGSISQYFWWNKVDFKENNSAIKKLIIVFGVLLVLSLGIIFYMDYAYDRLSHVLVGLKSKSSIMPLISVVFTTLSYVLLLGFSFFSIFITGKLYFTKLKNKPLYAGGVVAHAGIAIMLIGILFSSGYSKTTSINQSGLLYSKEFSTEMNLENVLLWRSKSLDMPPYTLLYKGPYIELKDLDGLISKDVITINEKEHEAIFRKDYASFKKGDSVRVNPENTYFEVQYTDAKKDTFILYPRAQANPSMGLLASPDIKSLLTKDLYTFIASIPDPTQDKTWGDTTIYEIGIGDTTFMNDFVVSLDLVKQISSTDDISIQEGAVAIQAHFSVFTETEVLSMKPILVVGNEFAQASEETLEDAGIRISFVGFNNETKKFKFAVNTTQRDYIILKVIEKPMINLLWIGSFVMVFGLIISMVRRIKE